MANNQIAYGFYDSQSLFNQRVAEVGVETTYRMVQESTRQWTDEVNRILSLFVERTTVAQEQIELPDYATLQPMDEWGQPLPTQPTGAYQMAWPVLGGATAWARNRIASAMMTLEEANRWTVTAMQADANWMMRQVLFALLNNTSWTFNDKIGPGGRRGLGNLTINPLANGDTVVYLKKGAQQAATDDHYLAQAAAIADNANPFPTIYSELSEHPSNAGPYVVYIPTDLKATTTALTEFVEVGDADIILGSASDRLARTADVLGPGTEVLGKTKSGCWIVEWDRLPDGYMVGMALGTPEPILRMREYPAPQLQGFYPEAFNPAAGLSTLSLFRWAGFGASNRVGACVYYVGGAQYTVPAGYDAPQSM